MYQTKIRRRAVSPLIATVLLIGFAVSLAVLVWFWYGSLIKERTDKTSGIGSGEIACSTEVKYRVKSVCYKDQNVIVEIENKGTNLDDLRFQIQTLGPQETITKSIGTVITKTEIKQISMPYDNTLDQVSLIPVVIRQSKPTVCTDQKIELKSITECQIP